MFEYMAAGIPVVASNFPLWERIVRDADCGVTVNPLDPQEIADAVRGLVDEVDRAQQMGEAGRKAVVTKYRWASEWEKLRGLYEVKEG